MKIIHTNTKPKAVNRISVERTNDIFGQRQYYFIHIVAIIAGLFATTNLIAQSGFEADRLHPAPNQSNDYFSVYSSRLLPQFDWTAGLEFSYVSKPVVIDDTSTLTPVYAPPYNGEVVTSQSLLHVLGAFGVTDWFQIGVDIPVVVQQAGNNFTGLNKTQAVDSSAGIGDIRLVPQLRLFQTKATERDHQFLGSIVVDMGMPTGKRERYQSGGMRLTPMLAAEWRSPVGFKLACNFGYAWRNNHVAIAKEKVESAIIWRAAAEAPILKNHLAVLVEVFNDLESELLFGLRGRVFQNIFVTAAAGTGMERADTLSPDWRMILGVSYRGGKQPLSDVDGDGIWDKQDNCPNKAEDKDNFEDQDGCPELDNDGDQIPDIEDMCPMSAEDMDMHEDSDGCPDFDNDGDGIVDTMDGCINVPEDRDAYQDGDGCPEQDNDKDGISDENDMCPNDPEDPDGDADGDGCPDFAPVIRVSLVVFFDPNLDIIRSTDQLQLDNLAHTLISMPNNMHIWIEGHADERGDAVSNSNLALRRATAVQHYLRQKGVPDDTMTPHSYGDTKGLLLGKSDPDHQGNRRVEFRIGPKSFVKEKK